MRLSLLLAIAALAIGSYAVEDRIIESSSLVPCMKNSMFYASLFRIVFTPKNRTLTYEINGESKVSSFVILDLQVQAYGYSALRRTLNPCDGDDLRGLCPMTTGSMANMKSNFILTKDTMKQIPDIDGKVRVWINSTETGKPLACVEAEIRNGKTVHQQGVSWTLAIITGLCMVIAGFMSGFGNFSTAAHISAKVLAIISYFQAQALIGMMTIPFPPIIRAWTQNFQWSMGIIRAHFLESFATWYQRSTGGRPARLFYSLFTTSIHVQKRSNDRGQNPQAEIKTLKGMERVAFLAHIEITNVFFTGYVMFVAVLFITMILVATFKVICDFFARNYWMKPDRFFEFRRSWIMILKGILVRMTMIGSLPLIVLCCFEFTRKDSSAEVVLSVWMFIFVITILTIASIKIWRIASRSEQLHNSAAYLLYSDQKLLNKWGFLYVQYKANLTSYLILLLVYSLIKGAFIGLGQKNDKAQVIGLFIMELFLLIAVSFLKPYMDKKMNSFNIAIASVNFINLFIVLLISKLFPTPPLAVGILGVVFFALNTVFAGVVVIMKIWTVIRAMTRHNPDRHYPAMPDDRHSFMKSQTVMATAELDALSKTARGESRLSEYSTRHIREERMSQDQDDIETGRRGRLSRDRMASREKSEKSNVAL